MSNDAYFREMLRYEPDRTATAYRTGLSAGDSTNVSSIGSIGFYSLQVEGQGQGMESGKTTLLVQGRFSGSTGTTSIWVVKGYVNTYGNPGTYGNTFNALVVETTSSALSASSVNDGSKYWSSEVLFDAAGCNFMKVCTGAVNTGTLDLWLRRV